MSLKLVESGERDIKSKLKRRLVMLQIKRDDFLRSIAWHMLGGRQKYQKNCQQLIRNHRWCFIVGCNNSGTSLVHRITDRSGIVSTHPLEGQFYTTALRRSQRKGFERVWTEYLDDIALTINDPVDNVPRLMHDWMENLEKPVKEMIVEKTPANATRMTWLQKVFPNSYFIGIVRNGYAVVEGICRKGNKSVRRGAKHWSMVNQIMREQSVNLDNYLQVKYEDLTEHPRESAIEIGEFLNIPTDKIVAAQNTIFGFRTVLGKSDQPIRNMNSQSIAKLNSEDIKIINREAAACLKHFDYFQEEI